MAFKKLKTTVKGPKKRTAKKPAASSINIAARIRDKALRIVHREIYRLTLSDTCMLVLGRVPTIDPGQKHLLITCHHPRCPERNGLIQQGRYFLSVEPIFSENLDYSPGPKYQSKDAVSHDKGAKAKRGLGAAGNLLFCLTCFESLGREEGGFRKELAPKNNNTMIWTLESLFRKVVPETRPPQAVSLPNSSYILSTPQAFALHKWKAVTAFEIRSYNFEDDELAEWIEGEEPEDGVGALYPSEEERDKLCLLGNDERTADEIDLTAWDVKGRRLSELLTLVDDMADEIRGFGATGSAYVWEPATVGVLKWQKRTADPAEFYSPWRAATPPESCIDSLEQGTTPPRYTTPS